MTSTRREPSISPHVRSGDVSRCLDRLRGSRLARCNTLTLPSHIERTADAFATPLQHMGIDHGGADILVPQPFLHGANVITSFEQMSRKALAPPLATS